MPLDMQIQATLGGVAAPAALQQPLLHSSTSRSREHRALKDSQGSIPPCTTFPDSHLQLSMPKVILWETFPRMNGKYLNEIPRI